MVFGYRTFLIVGAIALFVYVMYSIRKSSMRIEDTVFWVGVSAFILVIAFFPAILSVPSRWIGFQSPVNFVFLLFISLLLLKCFLNSRQISRLETKVRELTQQVAIDRLDHHDRTQGGE